MSPRTKRILQSCAWAMQRALRPLGLQASRRVGKRRVRFELASDIGMQLLITGKFESEAIAHCAKFIAPDGVVIDVGANIGLHAVQFATRAHRGLVLALEPARRALPLLLHNLRDLPNAVPLSVGLADSSGVRTFFVADDSAYSGLKDTGRKRILAEERIVCYSGDDLFAPLLAGKRIDLVKIDVEGLETPILKGMQRLLRMHQPVIFCEVFAGQASNPDPDETVSWCRSLGYEAFVLKHGRLEPAGAHDDNFYHYFFVPPQRVHLATLPTAARRDSELVASR